MTEYRSKNTKITAKISDLNCSVDFLRELYDAGLDVAWLNTAHQSEEEMCAVIGQCREASTKLAIMVDTKGPEIRTIKFDKPIPVEKGEKIIITGNPKAKGDKVLVLDYPNIHKEVPITANILIDDGVFQFTVLEKTKDGLLCESDKTGEIKKRKSVNIPDVHIELPSLTEKDKRFLKLSVEQKVEFIAHSFVRNKEDVLLVRKILDSHGGQGIKIVAKIENREGVDNVKEILDVADGVMVARGDLAVEVPATEVPLMQKMMIEEASKRGKISFVATQMLESMIESPRPTRAEVSDIATAILDGADSTCLSGETAYGKYPVASVKMMSLVSLDLKKNLLHTNPYNIEHIKGSSDEDFFFTRAAFDAAISLDVKAIIVPSVTGKTVEYLSTMRARKPIYAFCYDERVMRQLAVRHGVFTEKIDMAQSTDELVHTCVAKLMELEYFSMDDRILILAGTPSREQHRTNFLEIGRISDFITEYGKKMVSQRDE